MPSPRHSTPPIPAAPEAPLPGPEAKPSAPTAAEASMVETKRSKPRAPAHWAELRSNWRRKGVMSRISELFKEAGAEGTYEDLVDRSYILINGMNPSETAFLETFKVGSDQHPTRRALERCCLFGCGECGEPFSRMANLVRHWEIHCRQLIADISAGSDETIELSGAAEFQGLALRRALLRPWSDARDQFQLKSCFRRQPDTFVTWSRR
ncbi:hypothetical protein A4X09_0g7807 [Tilletia walkeri]|uniref:C2H2-type domain-containing protein n=1 Tax=Tilletia walkeri TaxID=117179 RepID=A0A8X7N2G1_9BASI|nr:hypothetical protein A4X09_0g7807 [Tilletia walkeri]